MSVTQEDVARLAGVSRQLVSLVVRGDPRVSAQRRRAVKRAMAELNYRPNAAARALVERRSGVIGVLIPSIANPFFGNVVDHLHDPAVMRGYTPLVEFAREDPQREREAIDHFLRIGVAGIVVVAPLLGADDLREFADEAAMAVIARDSMGDRIDTVSSASHRGGFLATAHAIEAGYAHVVYAGRHHPLDGSVLGQRRQGYIDAMAEAGRGEDAFAVDTTSHVGQAIDETFDRVGSTDCCFVALNDLVALEIIAELGARGLTPGLDVGVTGYDNTYLAGMHGFEITSIDQNYSDCADSVMEFLVSRMASPDQPGRHHIVEPTLVRRRSTRRHSWAKPKTTIRAGRAGSERPGEGA